MISTAWDVNIGTVAAPTDFTTRVLSMNINQTVNVNVFGRGVATITLLNKDGALTPGGGGTYSSTDWFAQGVFISALTNIGAGDTTTQVFHGIITDFNLYDDGVFSTVTITAQDGYVVGGRTTAALNLFPSVSINYSFALQVYLEGAPGYGSVFFPLMGKTDPDILVTNLSGEELTVTTPATAFTGTFADIWQQGLIPAAADILWPTTIENKSGTEIEYRVNSTPATLTRLLANRVDFEFVPQSSVTGTKFPFDINDFTQEFNNDDLVTEAQYQGSYVGSAAITSTNTTGTSAYGSRTLAFTSTWLPDVATVTAMATNMTNRYSAAEFTPASLSLKASQVKAYCADAAHSQWYNLLGISSGLWQKASITWTGSGAVSQTATSCISGRQISVTPEDTVISLSLLNWTDNHSFILDTDILGGTGITYNQPEIIYDENGWIYDDANVEQGDRLG